MMTSTNKNLIRYCHECGTVGEVPAGKKDCCPDGSHAAMVPIEVAVQAYAGLISKLNGGLSDRKEPEVIEINPPADWRLLNTDYTNIFNAIAAATGTVTKREAIKVSVRTFLEYLDKHQPKPKFRLKKDTDGSFKLEVGRETEESS